MTDLDATFAAHNEELRSAADALSAWGNYEDIGPDQLEYTVVGDFWGTLSRLGMTVLVSREYEHFLMALSTHENGEPYITHLKVPHPSGIAVHPDTSSVAIACTRCPNQVYHFAPVGQSIERGDAGVDEDSLRNNPLMPLSIHVYPGCLYIHDLAWVGNELHANFVGENAVGALHDDGSYKRVWWPKCTEVNGNPVFDLNYIQLNSIAAGDTIEQSYFSASAEELGEFRPGDVEFPVDGRGVIFAGDTREPIARGLTRPHSARLHNNNIWVDNSGYGEVGFVEDEKLTVVRTLPGWTRGLCFCDDVAFVGTSRVIPRFKQYAPGLDVDKSQCGVHAIDCTSGEVIGSIFWPNGNQIFAIEAIPASVSRGFALSSEGRNSLYYSFRSTRDNDKL